MPDADRRALYEFDRFVVDPNQRLLFLAGDSRPIELPPRAFEALLYLVERPGELLPKRDLLKALWPEVIVEENSLNQVISLIRKVLGEKPSEHRYIVTTPGRGYRFVAAVRARGDTQPDEREVDGLSLAVLPFEYHSENRGGVPGKDDFGKAIAADLIRLLSARSKIRVAAHTSSFAFNGVASDMQRDARAIAKALNVAKVLVGQVTSEAGHLSVTAHLLDGKSGMPAKSISQRRAAGDLVELQSDLAREIAEALDPESTATTNRSTAVDTDTYLLYLRALVLSMTPDMERVMTSIALLREAADRDPAFPRAKSLLAIQYTSCVMFGFPFAGALDLARHEVAQALSLDDQNGETHCAAAVIDCLGGAWARAEERFRIAHTLTADPLVSGLRCAYLSLSVGQVERAFQQAEHALKVAPTHSIGVSMLATLHMTKGQNDQAMRYAHLAIELGQSKSLAPLADTLCELFLRAEKFSDAADSLTALFPASAKTPTLTHAIQSVCGPNRTPRESKEAADALQEVERSLTPEALDPPLRKRLMLRYASLGALDYAFELAFSSLDHYAREGTVGGAWGVLWLPEMIAFRNDERFQLFARRLRLFEYWSEYGPPDGHSLIGARLSQAN